MNATSVTTGEARLSYANLFNAVVREQGQEPKYGVTILVPKTDTATKAAIDAAISAAYEQGVTKCWSGVRLQQPAICVHDGDGSRPSDGEAFGAECKGCWVFTASSKSAPFVVDLNVQPILQQTEVYSGMYGRVSVNFFPYNSHGKKGIGCGLNGVQKTRDGEPLASHVTAEDAFGAPAGAAVPGYPQQAFAQAPSYPQQAYTAPAYPAYGQPAAPAYPQQPAGGINPFTGLSV